ncbi:phage portal protein [Pedobacter metabolipauper]|uniref:SPP1 family phage portal protein n=1 Tax=Pedobacter metabolipauper TaxID=425513 RepID=A0A4V3D1R1_9SPHI|nr:phage portal protein [Pedobacter metabolipauper]TDQ12173.1 SPP1 family phage portal protein [Pedobacter metabolipauper]
MAITETTLVVEIDKTDVKQLLLAGMVDEAKPLFSTRKDKVATATEQWNVATHKIHERPKKYVEMEEVPQAKIPLPYQRKIVQSAVAFLFGKPVKLIQLSEGTDKAFKRIDDLWTEMRMATLNRKNARALFSQTASAKLFVEYKDIEEDGSKAFNSIKCILLNKDNGNDLYYKKDQYGVMQCIARGFTTKNGDKITEHFHAEFKDVIITCSKIEGSWYIKSEVNLAKKIRYSYYEQDETEWDIVQAIIERQEMLVSKRSDNNDYTADSILVLTGDVESLPGKEETGKVVKLSGEGADAKYLSPSMAMDMVKDERTTWDNYILYFTDTPDLTSEQLKSMGQDSGKALEMKFFPAILKAMDKLELFEEMTDREINILKAMVTNILDVSPEMKKQMKELKIGYQFGNPLPDNVKDFLDMLSTSVGGKPIMSQKTAVELNPLIKDGDAENLQINKESISTIED